MKNAKIFISMLCALPLTAYVSAADVQLDPVIVRADRIPVAGSLADDTIASSAVRTRDDLERAGVTSLGAALRTLPGVSTTSYGADHVDFDNHNVEARLRGSSAPATILINGAPIGVTGRLPLSSLPVEAVERIEVLPSGASAYGTGGAINIVTTATDTPTTTDTRIGFSRSNRSDRTLSFAVTASDFRIGGRHLRDGGIAQTGAVDKKGLYSHRKPGQQSSVYASWKINPHWTVFAGHNNTRSIWGDTDPKGIKSWDGHWKLRTNYLTAMYHTDRTRLTLSYGDRTRYYTTYDQNQPGEISGTDYRSRTWRADLQQELTRRTHDAWTLKAAVGTERYRGLRGSTRRGSRTQWDTAISYRWTPNDRYETRLTLGFSLIDDMSGHTHAWLPTWEQRYRVSSTDEWYTSVSKSMAMPTVSDYFNHIDKKDAHTPETAQRYEVGFRHISGHTQWQLTAFHTDVSHKIDKTRKNRKVTITRIGEVRTDGVELSYRYRPDTHWYAGASLTYANAREQAKPGKPFERSGARWLATAEVGYATEQWDININGSSRIGRPDGIADLFLLNLNARYRLSPDAQIRLTIDNLLDRRDIARDSRRSTYYTDPRRITFGLEYRFQ